MNQREFLRQYLSFGFVPDAALASGYVEDLFGAPESAAGDATKLLVDIVANRTAGASGVAIPLSGGRDSRALLGAALEIFPAGRIHCFTFGSIGSADVEGASAVCRTAKVSHRIVDPDALEWDLDALTGEMQRRISAGAGIPPVDGMHIFGKVAALVPADMPVLSGYLGIVAVGKHLGETVAEEANSEVVERFLRQNRGVLDHGPDDAIFGKHLESSEPLLEQWPGLTRFDLLDFGFRQRLRIRSSVTGSFANAVRIFEDRRWIGHWFSRPLAERTGYSDYDDRLARAFPLVFGRQPLRSRIRRWRGRRRGRGAYRGDPRKNSSMAAALKEACQAFDRRQLDLGESAISAFERLLREPSLTTFRSVRWFATAEILARAQERRG